MTRAIIIKIITLFIITLSAESGAVVIPVTGASLLLIAATNTAILGINASMIPFIKTTSDNTGRIYLEAVKTNKKLTQINTDIVKNRIKDETNKMINTLYGKDKLSGATWNFSEAGTSVQVDELDASLAIKNLKNQFTNANSHLPYNISNVIFHEALGTGNGEMVLSDFQNILLNNLTFEIGVMNKLAKIKHEIIDKMNAKSRLNNYMDNINATMTIKGSIDLNNLLTLESLIQNKFALEIQANREIIDTYNIIKKSSTDLNVHNSGGDLVSFTIIN